MSRDYKPYIVKDGDHVELLAFRAGADPDEVWNHPSNDALRASRPSMHLLAPGDVVHLPTGEAEGLKLSRSTTNRYRAVVPKVCCRIVVGDDNGVYANEAYEVQGLPRRQGAAPQTGTTDAQGTAALTLPVTVREVTLFFPKRHRAFEIHVGGLDPIEEPSGVAQRLRNLGLLPPGPVDDGLYERAIRTFQVRVGLPPTGVLDPATRAKLAEVAGH